MDITKYFDNEDTLICEKDIHKNRLENHILKLKQNTIIDISQYGYYLNLLNKYNILYNFGSVIELLNKAKECNYENYDKLFKSLVKYVSTIFNKQLDIEIENIPKYIIDCIHTDFIKSSSRMTYSTDQNNAVIKLIKFLYNPNERGFNLLGSAGSGKTTLIVDLMSYLLKNKYIKKIAMTAPTNKAVNILQTKLEPYFEDLMELNKISENKMHIEFLTIHRLLSYEGDYDINGNKIFVKKKKNIMDQYDIIVIDECSMIPKDLLINIFNELRNLSHSIKIIFLGDPCQLLAVNEHSNLLFTKSINDISNMQTEMLIQIVRSNNDNIVNLSNAIREWILDDKYKIAIFKYKGKGVYVYNCERNQKKTDTIWFKKCVDRIKDLTNIKSTIILAWTKNQVDKYNQEARKTIFNTNSSETIVSDQIVEYKKGDVLVFSDYYNGCAKQKCYDTDTKNMEGRFYTSEQIKIMDVESYIKKCTKFNEKPKTTIKKIVQNKAIIDKYITTIKNINNNISLSYNVMKLHAQKMTEVTIKNIIPETYEINVLETKIKEANKKDIEFVTNEIKQLRNYYYQNNSQLIKTIDDEIINKLWRELNINLIDPFANVNYGLSLTSHKSQSSTYCHVFVDTDDIFLNMNNIEAKRALYTSVTRASEEVHILCRK